MSIRVPCRLFALALVCSGLAQAAPILMSREAVLLDFAPGGGQIYRYSYTLSGATLLRNQEIDIRFEPANYRSLANAVAGPGFDVLLLQPDNPPGSPGDLSILALIDNPSLLSPFRVDAIYIGQGTPGPQPFSINQLDEDGRITSVIASGFAQAPVPEPAGWMLGWLGLASLVFGKALRRLRRRAAR